MNHANIIKKISLDNVAYYLFCLILFFVPYNTRKIIPSQYTYFTGHINEFVTYSLYLTDILAVFFILICIIKERRSLKVISMNSFAKTPEKIIILMFGWILLPMVFAGKYFDLSLYYSARIGLYMFLAIMIRFVINSRKRLILSLFVISIMGTLQGILAFIQFLAQSSIFGSGLIHKITGESLIASDIVGTSNVIIGSYKIIRAYGTFPHPNIVAGYLVLTLLVTFYLFMIATQKNKKVNDDVYVSFLNYKMHIHKALLLLFIIIQNCGLVVTFSRSGLIAIFITIFIDVFVYKIVSRETINGAFMSIRHSPASSRLLYYGLISITFSIIFFASFAFIQRMSSESLDHQSFQDRILLQNVSRETILAHPLFGVGIGSYILNLNDLYSDRIVNFWQYQPVHNLYLLIATEIGLPGLVLFVYLLYFLYNNNSKKKYVNYEISYEFLLFRSIIVAIAILGLFDHYLWTSPQMMMFMWIIFGLMISGKNLLNVPRETLGLDRDI